MSRATEIYSHEFDSILSKLPARLRELIESKIHQVGSRLSDYPHHRMKGRSEYRLRVGDYRVIYDFDRQKKILYLITLGNRRDIYR